MRKITPFLILFLLSITVLAQTGSKEENAVHQSVENLFAALTNTDTTALKQSCTGDVKFYEYGKIWTIDTLIQFVIQSKSIPGFKRTNSFEFISTTINKKNAWTTYFLQSVFMRHGKEEKVNWMETVVLIKEKHTWKIKLLHSTKLFKK